MSSSRQVTGKKRKFAEVHKSARVDPRADEDDDNISDDEYDHVASGSASGASRPAGSSAKRADNLSGGLNIAGLQASLAEFRSDPPWIERLEVVSAEPIAADAGDDLKLELAL